MSVRARNRLLLLGLVLVVGGFARARVVRALLTDLLVEAPNAGRSIDRSRVAPLPAGTKGEALRLTTPDGESLAVWILEPEQPAVGTVFVLHGIRASKGAVVGFGRALVGEGLRAVLVDLRGHGQSTGEALGYGLFARRDLPSLLADLEQRGLVEAPFGALGFGYGAASACLWAAEDPRLRAVVSLAAFADLADTLEPAADHMLGPLSLLVTDSDREAVLRAGSERIGLDLSESRPIDAVSRSGARFWIGHARGDPKIPFDHAKRLARAAGDRGELHLVDATGHDVSLFRAPARAAELVVWLRVQLVRRR